MLVGCAVEPWVQSIAWPAGMRLCCARAGQAAKRRPELGATSERCSVLCGIFKREEPPLMPPSTLGKAAEEQ